MSDNETGYKDPVLIIELHVFKDGKQAGIIHKVDGKFKQYLSSSYTGVVLTGTIFDKLIDSLSVDVKNKALAMRKIDGNYHWFEYNGWIEAADELKGLSWNGQGKDRI